MVEVLDRAPAELTDSERLLLIVLAEGARDSTRLSSPGMDRIVHRMHMDKRSVRRVMVRLAERGYDVRVQLGTDSIGRPVYAAKGHATTYRIPRFPDPAEAAEPATEDPEPPPEEEPADDPWAFTEDPSKGGHRGPPLADPNETENDAMADSRDPQRGTHGSPSSLRAFKALPSVALLDTSGAEVGDDIERDLLGWPVGPLNPGSQVPGIVAAYVNAVRETGGYATAAMCAAIGRNAKTLLERDKLHPAVILVAAQRAGARRAKVLDPFLGDLQSTFEAGGSARKAMFEHWARMINGTEEQPKPAIPSPKEIEG